MSQPRLLFLWPPAILSPSRFITKVRYKPVPRPLRSVQCRTSIRFRHGPAVDPSSLNPDPAPKEKESKETEASPSPTSPPILPSQPPLPNAPIPPSISPPTPPPAPTTAPLPTTATSGETPSSTLAPLSLDNPTEDAPPTPLPITAHYFDTFQLVSRLEAAGFTKPQAITAMNLIRALLSTHLNAAKANLVDQSSVDDSSYLFTAACSELRSEIQSLRQRQLEKMRSERMMIQAECDMLSQRFMEDLMNLKNELNSMFNDRKMVTRAEQRAMENKIQELNYKITVLINSDLKSEVEALRWVTTRRALIAIGLLASFIVAMIKLSKKGNYDKKKKGEPPTIIPPDSSSYDGGSSGGVGTTTGQNGNQIPLTADGLAYTV